MKKQVKKFEEMTNSEKWEMHYRLHRSAIRGKDGIAAAYHLSQMDFYLSASNKEAK